MYFSSNKALEQTAWDQLVIGMGLLKDREMPVGSARLLSIDVRQPMVLLKGNASLYEMRIYHGLGIKIRIHISTLVLRRCYIAGWVSLLFRVD
jgi:hypothetical protein